MLNRTFIFLRSAALMVVSFSMTALVPGAAPALRGVPMVAGGAVGGTRTEAASGAPNAGAKGAPGLAIRTAKALVVAPDRTQTQVIDKAVVLVKDGKIERVGPAGELEVPEGYELLDVGDRWVMPGIIELHCHIGGTGDINDMVYLTNPGLSVRGAVIPDNQALRMGMAAGVTSVLFIPGSGTNIGGAGILIKAGHDKYEDAVLRDPGSMKLAQWGNPESWGPRIGMSFENYNTRNTIQRGKAYAQAWAAFERGEGPEPERNIQWDLFRDLVGKNVPISTHTQMYQVVLTTITMVKVELGLNVFLDHSTIGGWLTAGLAAENNVPAIVGPRVIDTLARGMIRWCRNKHEGVRGVAAGYQQGGLENVGFNTDAPVIPQEELPLQAATAVRYGFDDSALQAVRGLTVVPAMTANIADRIGSLTPGLDADLLILDGHPADPRTTISIAFVDGVKALDLSEDKRLW